jgi:CHASE2 domain-containing sensor protein
MVVTSLLLGMRQLSLFEAWELGVFDQSVRSRPALKPDPRLLVVTITEADIQAQKQWPLSDAAMHQLLEKLEQYQPAVIGLDIYRDLPVEPGHVAFAAKMRTSDRIIPICKVSDSESPGVPPPQGVPVDRVGFSDVVVDPDGIIRRGLLFMDPPPMSPCATPYSFSFQLAQRYLKKQGIPPQLTDQEYLQFGDIIFKPLSPDAGGYQQIDAGGYQILLNYRAPTSVAKQVTLSEVLNNQLNPSWVRNRIVLIGSTAPSLKDTFYTPYSGSNRQNQRMAGVVIHAQLVSQIISTVLDGRPLFWFWSNWAEVLWIWGWSLIGGILAWRVRHPGHLVLAESVALGVLLGTSGLMFLRMGWVPVVAPVLALVATGGSVITYTAYQSQQEQKKIALLAQEQEKAITLLKALLNDRTYAPAQATPAASDQLTQTPTQEQTTTLPQSSADTPIPQVAPSHTDLLDKRYKTISVLGSGGFGVSYLAEDTKRPGNPQCVVKHLQPARHDEMFLRVARRLFHTEAEILEQLGRHPQIPHLLAYFEENQEFYLVEEFIPGHSLSEELLVDRRLPESFVVDLLKQVLEILAFIHDHYVIHRDIKPSNIIRRQPDERLVLIDFGAVKQIQPQQPENQEGFTIAIGTRGYTPPEQYAGQPNFSSDIYALGMIAIQSLTGRFPNHLPSDPNTGNVLWRHLASTGEELAAIIDKMVCYHFVERYQSATVVLHDLRRLADL